MKTNVLLPLLGYGSVSSSRFLEATEKFFGGISGQVGVSTSSSSPLSISRTFLALHDVKNLLEKFSSGESVSAQAQGGSLTSNCHHLIRLLTFARSVVRVAELNCELGPARANATPPAWVVCATMKSLPQQRRRAVEASAAFAAICSLALEHANFWSGYRHLFLKALLKAPSVAAPELVRPGRARAPSLSSWDEAAAEAGSGILSTSAGSSSKRGERQRVAKRREP